ncbi:MAG: hypothetical protein D6702_09140 [Planctomycetota bacterium]|nr:MAG: hypothetical protein D6702_09140 [Planctomycetota bacterium]
MLCIYYHRDFDGIASAAILAEALEAVRHERDVSWAGVNFDRTLDWRRFGGDGRFAVVDFHYHPRAEYWFDHHPTTFLDQRDEAGFRDHDRAAFDPEARSCPPIILRHAAERWGWRPPARFHDLAHWSDVIDSASYASVEQALFGTEPALRISRSLTCAPNFDYHDRLVALMRGAELADIVADPEVAACALRAERNRDQALEAFPANVVDRTPTVVWADLRSKKIRRERFAPFYLYPELRYAVTLLPTRAGLHITVSSNPWNRPEGGPHLGRLMKDYGGGGHRGVGGCNPPSPEVAVGWCEELFARLTAEG